MEAVPVQLSNAGRLYQARFEAARELFETAKEESDDTYRNSCIELLSDEQCPLCYRVVLHVCSGV